MHHQRVPSPTALRSGLQGMQLINADRQTVKVYGLQLVTSGPPHVVPPSFPAAWLIHVLAYFHYFHGLVRFGCFNRANQPGGKREVYAAFFDVQYMFHNQHHLNRSRYIRGMQALDRTIHVDKPYLPVLHTHATKACVIVSSAAAQVQVAPIKPGGSRQAQLNLQWDSVGATYRYSGQGLHILAQSLQ